MPALEIHIEKQVDTRKVKDRDYCYEQIDQDIKAGKKCSQLWWNLENEATANEKYKNRV